MKITPVSAIHNVRSLNRVCHRRNLFSQHLKRAVQKKNPRQPFKIDMVKSAAYGRSAYSGPIRDDPDFRVSISQSARNRMVNTDVIDLVPAVASNQTIVFKPILFSA